MPKKVFWRVYKIVPFFECFISLLAFSLYWFGSLPLVTNSIWNAFSISDFIKKETIVDAFESINGILIIFAPYVKLFNFHYKCESFRA